MLALQAPGHFTRRTLHAPGHLRGKRRGCTETFAARSAGMRGHAVAYLVARIFHGKPVAAAEQVRGGLCPENAPIAIRIVRSRRSLLCALMLALSIATPAAAPTAAG